MNTEEYKNLYEEWCSLRNWNLGPVFRHRTNENRFKFLSQSLEQELEPYLSDSDGRQVSLPTPWHAAFYLNLFQHLSILKQHGHPIFRGHADANWKLTPSIDRNPESSHFSIYSTVEYLIFSMAAARVSPDLGYFDGRNKKLNFTIQYPPSLFSSVAQHYGCKTPLLDFTADPNVAVYFASREIESRTNETCQILTHFFASTLKRDSAHQSIRIAPPTFTRPYLQKGLFIESLEPGDIENDIKPILTVNFPNHERNKEFRIVRGGPIDILPLSDDIQKICNIAKDGAIEFLTTLDASNIIDPDQMFSFTQDYVERDSNEKQFKEIRIKQPKNIGVLIGNFISEFEDMLYWLCYFTNYSKEEGLAMDLDNLDLIVRSNPEISLLVFKFYKHDMLESGLVECEPGSEKLFSLLCDYIAESLAKIGVKATAPYTIDDYAKTLHKSR